MLTFVYGTVSSAKTAQLLMAAFTCEGQGKGVMVMKSGVDTRFGSDIVKSRVGLSRKADVVLFTASDVTGACYHGIRHVFVDEAQFLDTSIVDALRLIADNSDMQVTCYGLRTDFCAQLFEGSRRLFEVADHCVELPSQCVKCGSNSVFNLRHDLAGVPIRQGPQIQLGVEDTYSAVCRKHFIGDDPARPTTATTSATSPALETAIIDASEMV